MKLLLTFLLTALAFPILRAQSAIPETLRALRIEEPVTLDGELKEPLWKNLPVADSFIVNYPDYGKASVFQTEVWLGYDDQAVYIAAELKDVTPDSVLAVLSQRDDFGNADWFGVLLDPYGSGQNAFAFYVTAAGVELDAIISQTDEDFTWNAVWKSRVVRTVDGWSLEIRIPLSQLRFPEQEIRDWKVNFKRQVRRRREMSYWSPVDPQLYGEITQSGRLEGMEQLRSPLRLSFSPYTTAYVENFYNDQSGDQEWRYRQRFGMDMKYGLSESFTLDATLVPDFGQTVSDNLILNLSPFEVRYNENRPFFLEGMDLFGIGDLFYTRRIGGPAMLAAEVADSLLSNGQTVTAIPSQAQLINATKISGRTKKGLGIGVFNAIENRGYIRSRDSLGNDYETLAHPLTNYNVLVFSQNLRNASNISIINSNVYRPDIDRIANVTGLNSLLLFKERKYRLDFQGKLSHTQQGSEGVTGHNIFVGAGKAQGSFMYKAEYYEMSDTYDQNELGFLPRNNLRGTYAETRWIGFKPQGRFLRRSLTASTNMEYLYNPSKFAYWYVNVFTLATFRNFLTASLESDVFPLGEVDHFESRTFGRPVNLPASFKIGGFYSSDYSKKFALDFSLYNRIYDAKGMANIDAEVSPRIRFSNRMFVVLTTGVSRYLHNYGYVRVTDADFTDRIILGTRNRWIVNNAIAADYTFTNRMGLVLRLNHYWQEVSYLGFRELRQDGWTDASAYSGLSDEDGSPLHNTSYNAFTVDMSFRWVIYPGSEIRFVWKYNIYASENILDLNYLYTFKGLFEQPQLNSFSVKALFFLDAGRLKKRN